VHIPSKYYEKIPKFYFVVGILLVASAISKGMDDFVAILHLFFGSTSIMYAVGVYKARAKHRNDPPAEDNQQAESESKSEIRDFP
jgi:hypothetical protein